MKDRTWIAMTSLHISAVIYFLVGVLFIVLTQITTDDFQLPFMYGALAMGFCLLLVLGIEVVAEGLRRRAYWAWIAGLCIFGLYLPSGFMPFGAFGLWGLLSQGSKASFGLNK